MKTIAAMVRLRCWRQRHWRSNSSRRGETHFAVCQASSSSSRPRSRSSPGADSIPPLIRADVERRLRAGRVTVFASSARTRAPQRRTLRARRCPGVPGIPGMRSPCRCTCGKPCSSTVTSSQIVNAMTWESHNVVAVPPDGLPSRSRGDWQLRGWVRA